MFEDSSVLDDLSLEPIEPSVFDGHFVLDKGKSDYRYRITAITNKDFDNDSIHWNYTLIA